MCTKFELPAGKGHLCLTHHVQESTQTWLGSSGFSPTVEPAKKDEQNTKRSQYIWVEVVKCFYLNDIVTLQLIKLINV